MSSSLFPLNITPQMTSIHPRSGLVKNPSGVTTSGPAISWPAISRSAAALGSRPPLGARAAIRSTATVWSSAKATRSVRATFWSRPTRVLIQANDETPTRHCLVRELVDHGLRRRARHFHDRVRIADLDLANLSALDSPFVADRGDDFASAETIARTHAEEQPGHPFTQRRARRFRRGTR